MQKKAKERSRQGGRAIAKRDTAKAARKRGGQTTFKQETFDKICSTIREGRVGVRGACLLHAIPRRTFYSWVSRRPELVADIQEARKQQCELRIEELDERYRLMEERLENAREDEHKILRLQLDLLRDKANFERFVLMSYDSQQFNSGKIKVEGNLTVSAAELRAQAWEQFEAMRAVAAQEAEYEEVK